MAVGGVGDEFFDLAAVSADARFDAFDLGLELEGVGVDVAGDADAWSGVVVAGECLADAGFEVGGALGVVAAGAVAGAGFALVVAVGGGSCLAGAGEPGLPAADADHAVAAAGAMDEAGEEEWVDGALAGGGMAGLEAVLDAAEVFG